MFGVSERSKGLAERLTAFMARHIYPNEQRYFLEAERLGPWAIYPIIDELKPLARTAGLWNLFQPEKESGQGLSNVDYAPLCEIMGRSLFAPEVFNCSAPDTGNMETILRHGTEAQKERWPKPLLAGKTRSAFAMTEPDVASSDATNIASAIRSRVTSTSSTAANGTPLTRRTPVARSSFSWGGFNLSLRIPIIDKQWS